MKLSRYRILLIITVLTVLLISLTLSACNSLLKGEQSITSRPITPFTQEVTEKPTEIPSNLDGPADYNESLLDPLSTPGILEKEINKMVSSMTIGEKIGQLLLVGCPVDGKVENLIQEYHIGGIVLFGKNFDTFEDLYNLTVKLKEYNEDNKLSLWIALDEEGGTVSRLPEGKTPIPSARIVGDYDNIDITKETGRVIGEEMKVAGTNLDFAPVVDIVKDTENKLMYKRSYGDNKEKVSRHGMAFLEGLHESSILGCAKHFPGHGDTVVDSHENMPIINKSFDEWWSYDAVPYKTMIQAGVDMIMVGHLAYPQIDTTGLPASLSSVFLKDILRDKMKFDGLIITDDIEMLGYPQGEEMKEAVINSFLAGVDMFAIGHTPETQQVVLESLKDAVVTGKITDRRLDESVKRIIIYKQKLNEIEDYSLEKAQRIFGSDEHYSAISSLIAD